MAGLCPEVRRSRMAVITSSAAASAARPQPDVEGIGVGVGWVPPDLRATVCPIPAATANQLVAPVDSCVGEFLLVP